MRIENWDYAIEAPDIIEAKIISDAVRERYARSGVDLPKHLGDVCFAIDVAYQKDHGEDEYDWEIRGGHLAERGLDL